MDGICDSPLTLPGKSVEVEGVELEPEERSMKGWSQVRRKVSQEEKVLEVEVVEVVVEVVVADLVKRI